MKSYLPVRVESHRFSTGDLIGGDAALDFVNTVTGRDQSPRDWLDSYTRLLEWAALVHLLPEKILRALEERRRASPQRLRRRWRGKKLRETLFALVTGIVSGVRRRKTRCPAATALDRRDQCARAALRPWARGR